MTQFPHSLKDWNDDDNPNMKEDAQSQEPFSLSEQRGQAGMKPQTSSHTPIPTPPKLQVPSSLPGALLPPAALPITFQVSPLVWFLPGTLAFKNSLCHPVCPHEP